MEVNNAILKLIVEECCCSLSYNDEERQFSFALKPNQYGIWERIKHQLQKISRTFSLGDFNNVLRNLTDAVDCFQLIPFTDIPDEDLMNGEIVELRVIPDRTFVFVKMKVGQYLDVTTGKGYSLGSSFRYKIGNSIKTSEGVDLGECKSISLRIPQKEHIALSSRFIGAYYKNHISQSLWDIYNEASTICNSERPAGTAICKKLLTMAKEKGINSFTLLNILKGASSESWKQ